MGILHINDSTKRDTVPRLDFELTTGCDHKCGHCYNVWGAEDEDPQGGYKKGSLRLDEYLAMMDKVIDQTGADHITITGGEPLLHKGALEIIEKACSKVSTVQLITNGSHITPEVARRFGKAGLRSVQLTLLSAQPHRHNLLKGADCFDDTVRAAMELREARVPVQVCFVAMRTNWEEFEEVMELCYVLGVGGISYNRMSPTGGAIHNVRRLLPEVEHVEHNLLTAERLGPKYKIHVATAMPVPPCLIRMERFKWVQFGFCSTGTHSPNIVVDPLGNIRSCNLSSGLLGNIIDEDWKTIFGRVTKYQTGFQKKVPEMCKGCRYERSCQGGCKESAFATFGATDHIEPFIYQARNPNWLTEKTADEGAPACPGALMGSS
ncbi:MAG: radical SAM/SPASM domain-containing protein [Bradymonadaceae bacterium]